MVGDGDAFGRLVGGCRAPYNGTFGLSRRGGTGRVRTAGMGHVVGVAWAGPPRPRSPPASSGATGRYPLCRFLHRYPGDVADALRVITAEELDAMSPDERARVVREHIVTDLGQLPDGFRRRVETTATRLAEQRRPATE